MPTISCIMPVYNTKKYLSEAIESILNQTYKDFEFIISDDWSTDWSKDIISFYAKKDSRIIFLDNKINRWIVDNLNDWIRISKWKYIAIMESDDISFPDRFEIQIKEFEKNPSLDLIWMNWYIIDSEGKNPVPFEKLNTDFSIFKDRYLFLYTFSSPSILIKKSVVERIWFFESPLLWDFNYYSRFLFEWYKWINLLQFWIKKRVHSTSLNSKKFFSIQNEYFKQRINMINKYNLPRKNILKVKTVRSYIFVSFAWWIVSPISKKLWIYDQLFNSYRKIFW